MNVELVHEFCGSQPSRHEFLFRVMNCSYLEKGLEKGIADGGTP